MPNAKISIIAALQIKDRGLGLDNELLFRIHEDLAWFKKLTMGHPIIMGRKTFESIGRILPGRTNIVITRNQDWNVPGIVIVHSLEEAISEAQKIETNEIFIIGGGSIYAESLAHTNRLYLTLIEGNQPANVFFPEYEKDFSKVIEQNEKATDQESGLQFHHLVLERN